MKTTKGFVIIHRNLKTGIAVWRGALSGGNFSTNEQERRERMIKKGTLFSGIIGGLCLGMAVASASLLPVHAAEEEDHTAGVSMGKEADEEISTYARARVEAGWKLIFVKLYSVFLRRFCGKHIFSCAHNKYDRKFKTFAFVYCHNSYNIVVFIDKLSAA